jgi:hypothetical protein
MDEVTKTAVLICPQCSLANEFPSGKRTEELKCLHCGNTFPRFEYGVHDTGGEVLPIKRRNLKSLSAVRKAMADVFNRVEQGHMGLEKAKTLGFIAQTLTKLIESAVVEKKIKLLEQQQKNGPTGVVK